MPFVDAAAAVHAATNRWGPRAARAAGDDDRVDGLAPLIVLEPTSGPMLAEMLRWAVTERLAVAPRGGGTKLSWGAVPSRLDAVLSTVGLSQPIDHCAGDLTATLPAGLRLDEANRALGRERQWLPLDPAAQGATVGGLLATNDSGPRRHKHGTPRDLVIGIEMALSDGRLAKAGGRVVKNVAGYDLSRLMCGSYGSLAVITSATFKLSPLPPASRTLVATLADPLRIGELALALAGASITPSAMELDGPPLQLAVRFETTEAAAEQQAAVAAGLCERHGAGTRLLAGDEESVLWHDWVARPWREQAVIKLTVAPADVGFVLARLDALTAEHGLTWRAGGRAALGVLVAGLSGEVGAQAALLATLREEVVAIGGWLVLLAAQPVLKTCVDPWGHVGDALTIMRAMKSRFDPHAMLNPGRGPGGL
jgi:glycolate oxidase FAD binding subunit